MKKYLFLLIAAVGIFSCTDLDEEIRDGLTLDQALNAADVGDLLAAAYTGLRNPYMTQNRIFALQEITGDNAIAPTRGGDWDDNGDWRVLHTHSWTADHSYIQTAFSELLQVAYNTTDLLQFDISAQQDAEARFLRAFVEYSVLDGWGQVPFRQPGGDLLLDAEVRDAATASSFIISELEAIVNNLPDGNAGATTATKEAAKVLLMKTYLNRGTYVKRSSPSFDQGDMAKVITLADEIMATGRYALTDNYFDNFATDNDARSTENIFSGLNERGTSAGDIRSRWFMTLHYNQNPSGWNGFTTLSDFYDSFEDGDMRKGGDYPGLTDVSGLGAGFLVGQQFDQNDVALEDRNGNPLDFTRDINLRESGDRLEVAGIRTIKYIPDFANLDVPDNDYVFYRLADVMLMKAEAMLRNGDAAGALEIVNTIRAKRGASDLGSLDLDGLLAERGRELYWEGHRRTDLIRFGKFLDAWQEKPASDATYLVLPIPSASLAGNPNLQQNPGY